MKFTDILINKDNYFSIGLEETSGKYYLSIPVSNEFVDYEEYYWIDKKSFELYKDDISSAFSFVQECREHLNDKLLIIKPGSSRGVPK